MSFAFGVAVVSVVSSASLARGGCGGSTLELNNGFVTDPVRPVIPGQSADEHSD